MNDPRDSATFEYQEQPTPSDASHAGSSPTIVSAELVSAKKDPPAPSLVPPALSVLLSWLLIVGLICVVLVFNSMRDERAPEEAAPSLDLMQANWIGKVLVAYREAAGPQAHIDFEQLPLEGSTWNERLCLAILRNELDSPTAAQAELDTLGVPDLELPPATPQQLRVSQLLGRLFGDYQAGQWSAPSLSTVDREYLVEQLGWFGRLALHGRNSPNDAGRRQVLLSSVVASLVTASLGLLFVGLVVLGGIGGIAALLSASTGRLKFRFPLRYHGGHIYAETFALWFLLFVVFSTLSGIVDLGRYKLFGAAAAFSASLIALVWPVLRGIPFEEVRRDIGWTRGSGWIREVCAGIVGYVCGFPILLAGLALFLMAAMLAGIGILPGPWLAANDQAPTHPLGGELLTGDPLILIGAYLVACLGAPLIEETVFRGVLYRHLRESTARGPRWLSALFSGGLNALVFAIIHPQGLLVVPALAALGFNFSLAREWRDSLIAPMAMHAVHNGALITAFILVFTW